MKLKKIITLLLTCVMILGFSVPSLAAINNGVIQEDIKLEFISNLINLGIIDVETQDRLIKKLEDGSVLQIEINTDEATKSFVKGNARDYSGSGYYVVENLKIVKQSGVVALGFYADFIYVQSGYDSIRRVHSPYCNVIGDSFESLSVSIINEFESPTQPAIARASVNASIVGWVVASGTHFTTLNVRNDSYYVN